MPSGDSTVPFVLAFTVLACTVLACTVLACTVLAFTVLACTNLPTTRTRAGRLGQQGRRDVGDSTGWWGEQEATGLRPALARWIETDDAGAVQAELGVGSDDITNLGAIVEQSRIEAPPGLASPRSPPSPCTVEPCTCQLQVDSMGHHGQASLSARQPHSDSMAMNDPDGIVTLEEDRGLPDAGLVRVGDAPDSNRPLWRDRFWHPRFWRELVMITGLYFVYQAIGDYTSGSHAVALSDALAEVHLEQSLGIFDERYIQSVALGVPGLAQFCNDYYATVHFVMPVVVLLWLWWRFPTRYRLWRNALAWLTLIGFVVFVAFPVMPPRLLPASFGFVDTMKTLGGAGRLDAALLSDVGASYAAMPSLHIAWAAWCAAAMIPIVRRRWLKVLLVADPVLTTFVVVVTANHFFVDVVAGVIVLLMGVGLAYVPWMRLCTALVGKVFGKQRVVSGVGEARRG